MQSILLVLVFHILAFGYVSGDNCGSRSLRFNELNMTCLGMCDYPLTRVKCFVNSSKTFEIPGLYNTVLTGPQDCIQFKVHNDLKITYQSIRCKFHSECMNSCIYTYELQIDSDNNNNSSYKYCDRNLFIIFFIVLLIWSIIYILLTQPITGNKVTFSV